jgi:hypothetical protein
LIEKNVRVNSKNVSGRANQPSFRLWK